MYQEIIVENTREELIQFLINNGNILFYIRI